jgi:hypothetical protein
MQVNVMRFQTVNGDAIIEFFDFLKEKYPAILFYELILDKHDNISITHSFLSIKKRALLFLRLPEKRREIAIWREKMKY